MSHRVCPWWLGYFLLSPIRRLGQNPHEVVAPFVKAGMTVLEPGPGMGFFTLELARLVGSSGRVVAVDLQPRMLATLKKRLSKASLQERVETRVASPNSLGIADLAGCVDFTLAFALVHELTAPELFFQEVAKASKPGAGLLFAEPTGHVKQAQFEAEINAAIGAGFEVVDHPKIRRSITAFLRKT